MTITIITAGLLGLLLLFLAGFVIAGRVQFKIDLIDAVDHFMPIGARWPQSPLNRAPSLG